MTSEKPEVLSAEIGNRLRSNFTLDEDGIYGIDAEKVFDTVMAWAVERGGEYVDVQVTELREVNVKVAFIMESDPKKRLVIKCNVGPDVTI